MSEGLIGAMIGAAAAILGGILGELIKYNLEIKKDNRQLLKSLYEEMENSTSILASYKDPVLLKIASVKNAEQLKSELGCNLSGKIALYCKKDIVEKWIEIREFISRSSFDQIVESNELKQKSRELLIMMRKDLKISTKDVED